MRVDIYRRPEHHGTYSYLAVPEGKPIPQEVTNTDWQDTVRALEIDEAAPVLPDYHIEQPARQIAAKGYAITSLKDMAG
ncbi:DUF6139 family protein [Janthinobacterium agaricidamnosum]|uniref:Uncharacterized protein n=1 Tax=Janthinobacterium agaricidamnosum NBRC 102515 = DSM 9628 TaxID=1349767 RepID=W0V2W2_9BURK|nr:DUF6139 family protein [Janthinobacterium agaricidamnosum]CDG81607.1 putative uncharacterized protein [Janthinobacterium agaricidamnosum NBRC 102515 = DSM 9628]